MADGLSDRARVMLVWPVAGFFVVIAFGVGLISMAAFDSASSPAAAPAGAATGVEPIRVELGDLFIKPERLEAPAGPATFEVVNVGATEHNFAIEGGPATPMIPPGESATLSVPDLKAGQYTYICEVTGHADGGMTGTLVVTGGGGSAGASAAPAHGGMSAREMARHDAAVTRSFPAETRGTGGTDLRPHVVDGVKVFELTADETRWEVSPGEVKPAYAYNGIVPGPTIRAELGDRVRIVLTNRLSEPTTIHFHGMTVPARMDGVPVMSQRAVLPGESFTYEFTIRNTGSNMYHSHFNAQKQVPMGLLGALIVPDPAEAAVDEDVTMVLNDGPLGFTMNGKGFPATAPIAVERGETFRIRYMNEGLQIHPMHLHGMPQKVVAKDGHLLPRPHMEDTVLVAPGERVDVLVEATEPGTWAFHCHVLNHAEGPDGMFGMVTAVVVR
ncbi:MAG TPA: multicopper oxidase domain-containing protein [Actinomycetota bacterium]|nr:multicopper oxidase domain-containing protein [Actinomycetota bacterium]